MFMTCPVHFRRKGVFAVALLLLSACAVPPASGPRAEPRTAGGVAAARSLSGDAAHWPAGTWWTGYGDAQLDRLMQEGVSASPDMAAAAARFRRAQALARGAGAALLPRLDAQGSVTMDRQSLNTGFPPEFKDVLPQGWHDHGLGALSFSLDLDLWGKNRAALAAATSETRAAAIDARQARLMLTTGIAQAYADLARLYVERDVRQGALDIRASTRKLVDDRMRSGLDTLGDVRQAEAGLSTARAELAAADEAIALRRNQIAALLGAGPDRGLDITRPALSVLTAHGLTAQGLPAGVTTDLIGRRPDIAAARARMEAAASRIKVARADFFPAISLSALVGVQALGLDDLVRRDSVYGSAGPAISLPIFHGGALTGRYRGARASYDEAVASYDRTVIDAYREVADAVTSQRALGQRLTDARAALAASEQAYGIARKRYEGGLSTYLDVLVVEERLLQARQTAATLAMRAFTLDVALVRALGGGFAATDILAKDRPNG
ncbi:MAG: efflux transporter outer membrane subunit [Sphingobium sp.]